MLLNLFSSVLDGLDPVVTAVEEYQEEFVEEELNHQQFLPLMEEENVLINQIGWEDFLLMKFFMS